MEPGPAKQGCTDCIKTLDLHQDKKPGSAPMADPELFLIPEFSIVPVSAGYGCQFLQAALASVHITVIPMPLNWSHVTAGLKLPMPVSAFRRAPFGPHIHGIVGHRLPLRRFVDGEHPSV